MTKITRISTTLTARYSPAGGSTDAFWLDSRMPGTRESRAADITLDREDRGFFFSVFAAPGISKDTAYDLEAVRPALEKMHNDVKHSQKNIDNLIVDFAECSSNVVGNKTIALEGVRHPFFAGVLVKEGEIAAITSGRGCAYLYRNDTLYPLTKNDLGFEPVDHSGHEVPNLDIYSAGSVGNVRYSNIANLQVDDCFILCNRELIAAIGQKEMLRILDEAYDQADAAGMAITAAASKLPNVSLQCLIGFVESVSEAGGRQPIKARAGVPVQRFTGKSALADEREDKVVVEDTAREEIVVDHDDDFDDDYYDDEEYEDTGLAKKVALTAVILVVTAACAFAIWWTVFRDKGGNTESSSQSSSQISSESISDVSSEISSSAESTVSETDSSQAESSAAPTTAPTSEPSGEFIATHTVVSGDTLSAIAQKYYQKSTNEYIQAIVNANKAAYPNMTAETIQPGWKLKIPKVG